MQWDFNEALEFYKSQGANSDQNELINFLKEIGSNCGGKIPVHLVGRIAEEYKLKENFILAIIKRIPNLNLENVHCMEVCSGAVCGKNKAFQSVISALQDNKPQNLEIKFTQCMHMCKFGPNIKLDGKVYNHMDENILKELLENIK